LPHVKFILPNAPIIDVHVPIAGAPGEAKLPAWWDPRLANGLSSAWTGKDTAVADVEGIEEATTNLEKIIDEEAKLVAPGRIFLGGFSQGTVLSLAVGLENDKVGGIIGKFFCFTFEVNDALIRWKLLKLFHLPFLYRTLSSLLVRRIVLHSKRPSSGLMAQLTTFP
jgi:hypothetical protein